MWSGTPESDKGSFPNVGHAHRQAALGTGVADPTPLLSAPAALQVPPGGRAGWRVSLRACGFSCRASSRACHPFWRRCRRGRRRGRNVRWSCRCAPRSSWRSCCGGHSAAATSGGATRDASRCGRPRRDTSCRRRRRNATTAPRHLIQSCQGAVVVLLLQRSARSWHGGAVPLRLSGGRSGCCATCGSAARLGAATHGHGHGGASGTSWLVCGASGARWRRGGRRRGDDGELRDLLRVRHVTRGRCKPQPADFSGRQLHVRQSQAV